MYMQESVNVKWRKDAKESLKEGHRYANREDRDRKKAEKQ